jgi:hypothetical protein
MDTAYWIPVCAFILLVLGWAFWLIYYKLPKRRKTLFDEQMAAYSQSLGPEPKPELEPGLQPQREISVAELAARLEAERCRDNRQ